MSDQIPCPNCSQLVRVPDLKVGVVNNDDASFLYVTHVTGVNCMCGAYLKPMIVNLPPGVFGWMPVDHPVDEDANGSRLIVPGLQLPPH